MVMREARCWADARKGELMSDHAHGPVLTRRQVLIGGAVVGGVLVSQGLGAPSTSAAAPPRPLLAGIVERVEAPATIRLRLLGDRGGAAVIKLAGAATILRGIGGHERELGAFIPGDEVVAMGAWAGAVYEATTVMSPFHLIEGLVEQRTGDTVRTAAGSVRLIPATRPLVGPRFAAKPLAQLVAGDQLVAEAWRDPVDGLLLAARVGVVRGR